MTDDRPVATGDGAVYYVIRPWESSSFKRCRRAWDLGARERQNYEPVEPQRAFDFEEAVHDALDVYYFPGMWEWNRAIVRPLAVQAFMRTMRRQRAAYAECRELSEAQQRNWDEYVGIGTTMLERYFLWTARADRFTPVQVATQFDVAVPVPGRPDEGLTAPDGRGVRYRVRIDMVVIDEHEQYWLVEHRIRGPAWAELDELVLDEGSLTRCWAWQTEFLGDIAGTVHNELRVAPYESDAAPDALDVRAMDGAHGYITQQGNDFFRRTQIPRGADECARRGTAMAHEALDMTDPALRIYPSPAWAHCAECAYRAPCLALNQGLDDAPILTSGYRRRITGDFEPGRLGYVWGFMPETPRIADHQPPRQRDG